MASVHSYRPMIAQVDTLFFGDAASVFVTDPEGRERHVERGLNVIASGFQHERYFQDVVQVVGDRFDHDNFDDQPRYVADMGCGHGTLLKRIYRTVTEKTRRGKYLALHPLVVIGVDFQCCGTRRMSQDTRGTAVRLVRGQAYADFGPSRRTLMLASTAFDASTFELWGPLLNDGTW